MVIRCAHQCLWHVVLGSSTNTSVNRWSPHTGLRYNLSADGKHTEVLTSAETGVISVSTQLHLPSQSSSASGSLVWVCVWNVQLDGSSSPLHMRTYNSCFLVTEATTEYPYSQTLDCRRVTCLADKGSTRKCSLIMFDLSRAHCCQVSHPGWRGDHLP